MGITELREFATIVENQTKQIIKFDNMIKKQDDLIKCADSLIEKLEEEKELYKKIEELNTLLDNMWQKTLSINFGRVYFYFITNSFILSTSFIILIFSAFDNLVGLFHWKAKKPTRCAKPFLSTYLSSKIAT